MEKFKVCVYQYGISGDIEVNEYDEVLESEQAATSYAKTITSDLNEGSDEKYYAIVKKLDDEQEFTIEMFSTYDKDVAFEVADIDEELAIEDGVYAADKNVKKYAKEISTLKKLKKEKNITGETNKPLDEAIELVVGWLNEFEKETEPLKEDKKEEAEKKNEEIDNKMDKEMDAPIVEKK